MPTQWLPTKDADLLTFSADMSAKITATPAAFGLVILDATSLAALVTSYSASLALSTDPVTATKVTRIAKSTAKGQLVADIRALAKRIQANLSVTAAQKTALGLPIHNLNPSSQPAPVTKPVVVIQDIGAASLLVRITDETTPTRRARAAGAIGAQVYTFAAAAGVTPPADTEAWTFKGMATTASFQVDYAAADAGKTAYIVARWVNRKGEVGPSSMVTTGPIAA